MKAQLMKPLNIETCFAGLTSDEIPLALATVVQVVSPTSGKPGDKALVSAEGIVEGWIGGGCAQQAVVEAARSALDCGKSSLIRIGPSGEWEPLGGVIDFTSDCLSGGTLMIFVEPLARQPTLGILGCSPVAHNLSYLARNMGFSVTMASPDLDPGELPDTIQHGLDFSAIDGEYLVIATMGKHDRAALTAALNSDARYIAMIASRKKMAGLKTRLTRAGFESSSLDRIHAPAGIEIGAVTPAEIALSVLADIVRVRRGISGEGSTPVSRHDGPELAAQSKTGECCGA
jgi:xanthine dehydrogenase accessory factor